MMSTVLPVKQYTMQPECPASLTMVRFFKLLENEKEESSSFASSDAKYVLLASP